MKKPSSKNTSILPFTKKISLKSINTLNSTNVNLLMLKKVLTFKIILSFSKLLFAEKVREHAAKQKEEIIHDTELHEKDIVQVHEHPEIKREKILEVHKHPESVDRKVVDVKEGHNHLVEKKGVQTKVLHKPKLHEKKVVELHEHPEIHHENVVEVHKRAEELDRKVVEKKQVGVELKSGTYKGTTGSTTIGTTSTSRGLTGGAGMTGTTYEKKVEVGTTKGTGGIIGTESSMSSMSESSMSESSMSGDDLKKHDKHKKHHHLFHHKHAHKKIR